MPTINASQFKSRCLALLDEVALTGEPLLILKRGKPVAQLIRPSTTEMSFPQHRLFGTVTITGDLLEPAVPEESWDAARGEFE